MYRLNLPSFPLLRATRDELDTELRVLEGKIPSDIFGHVFFNSPVGSPHSDGLPYQEYLPNGEKNPEYGTPLFNGDGMVFRLDFNSDGRVAIKSRILKTPDFYADEAMPLDSKYRKEAKYKKDFPFNNGGITRLSLVFGVRNQLNTAFLPFQFKDNEPTRLLATFDSGRPYEVDPVTLELLNPIGYNKTWRPSEPSFLKYIFPVVMSSSHPCFDTNTKELFGVNFCPDFSKIFSGQQIINAFRSEEQVKNAKSTLDKKTNNLFQRITNNALFRGIKKALYSIQASVGVRLRNDPHSYKPNTFLLRWKGKNEIERFRLVDEHGLPITISQSMHQMNFTKDYIILMDTSFKMALNIMMSEPFPNNVRLSRLIRKLTTRTMKAETYAYIVKRADLQKGDTDVKAIKLRDAIPMECVHFSTEYSNPDGKISMITTHNNALCLAEWTRPYDKTIHDPNQQVSADQVGMYNGAMDVSSLGRFVINAETGAFEQQKVIREMGDTKAIDTQNHQKIGANTWSTGLYTHAGIESPHATNDKIRYIFWQNLGLNDQMLTDFIAYLYSTYPHRKAPVDKIKEWVQKGIPGQVICVDTYTMKIVDYYQLPITVQNRSIQYLPKKGAPNAPTQRDGYLLITVLNEQTKDEKGKKYTRELWLFDAMNLAKGPICKLGHEDWIFAYTLHSTWLPTIASPSYAAFDYDIRADFDWRIQRVRSKKKRQLIQDFMEEHVYAKLEKRPKQSEEEVQDDSEVITQNVGEEVLIES